MITPPCYDCDENRDHCGQCGCCGVSSNLPPADPTFASRATTTTDGHPWVYALCPAGRPYLGPSDPIRAAQHVRIICTLPAGHAGNHYDASCDVSWPVEPVIEEPADV